MEKNQGKNHIKRYCLGPIWAYSKGQRCGTVFINIVIRKQLRMNMTIQIRDRKDFDSILDEYLIMIPIPGIKKLLMLAEKFRRIKTWKNNEKWEVKEYALVQTKEDQ